MFEEPELHVVRFNGDDEAREQRERERAEARASHRRRLAQALGLIETLDTTEERAEAILVHLFDHVDDSGNVCHCSCRPSLPASGHHDHGESCRCRQTAEQRRAWWDEWEAEREAYRSSPEGIAEQRARQEEESALVGWLAANPDVVVTQYGGWAPEQWMGSVAGHSFYFRERHDQWRIELDLRPSGRFSEVWKGGDLEDDESYEAREIEEGDVIAEGTVWSEGYGSTPVERIEFITDIIRTHLGRQTCRVHTAEALVEAEARLGAAVAYCPACGEHLE